MDPKDFRVLKAKAHIERVLMGRRNKVLDAHRDRCGARPLCRFGRPFWLGFTYATSVLVTKY
eukprot:COSAG01_NODE_1641_length_9647_cov_5.299539_18_plen_62_part_00